MQLPPIKDSVGILDVLEALRCGGFILDIDGRVLLLNMLARGYLKDGLVLSGHHLGAADHEADLLLQHAISASLCKEGAPPNAAVAVPRHTRLPLVIQLIPLGSQVQQSPRSAGALLLAFDPEPWPEPHCGMLEQAFGLTQTEAEVAIGVAAGRTLSKIAAERGVKIGTVRAHLKTIFSKTHSRTQADLTRVVMRLAFFAPHIHWSAPDLSRKRR
jgi:DNA-binding CsgD family transcriptional regulator